MSCPPACDPEVFKLGTAIVVCDTGDAGGNRNMERWILKVREASGQQVDWYYMGGRAVVKFIGDQDKVLEALRYLPARDPQITILFWVGVDSCS